MAKSFLFSLLFLIFFNSIAKQKGSSAFVTIKVELTETSDYCGGAQPSEEMLRNFKTPQPVSGKVIYIKSGSSNDASKPILQKAIADKDGRCSIKLKSGNTYCFIEEWKANPLVIPQNTEEIKWDAACIKARYKKADYVLVTKRSNNVVVKINYHNPCFYHPYCGEYSGPIPP